MIFPITLMIVCRVMGEGNVPGIEDLDAAIAALARFNLIIVVIIVRERCLELLLISPIFGLISVS